MLSSKTSGKVIRGAQVSTNHVCMQEKSDKYSKEEDNTNEVINCGGTIMNACKKIMKCTDMQIMKSDMQIDTCEMHEGDANRYPQCEELTGSSEAIMNVIV